MKRLAILATIIAMTLALTACQQPETDDAHQAIDDAIHEVQHEITEFYQLGPSAPPEELAAVIDELGARWSDLVDVAQGDEEFDLSDAQAAYDELAAAGESLASDENPAVADAATKMEAFRAAIDELHVSGDFH